MNKTTLKNGLVYYQSSLVEIDIVIEGSKIIKVGSNLEEGKIMDCTNKLIAPAFIEAHAHFREPGFEYKETIKTGSMAAAKGGYTKVMMMPNLNPAPDTLNKIKKMKEICQKDSLIECYPLATITKKRLGKTLVNFAILKDEVIGFSDDGSGIQNSKIIYDGLFKLKGAKSVMICHCEDLTLVNEGVIRESDYAKLHHHRPINPLSETLEAIRNMEIAYVLNTRIHLCHISSRYTVWAIQQFKKMGCKVSAEVTPHHLICTICDLENDGRFKMNPPLGDEEDQKALFNGVLDGTIDFIATDHAPHSVLEKSGGLDHSLFGIVGLETSFAAMYTYFVKTKKMPLELLLDLMSKKVSDCFPIKDSQIRVGNEASIVIIDLEQKFIVDSSEFLSKGKSSIFEGKTLYGVIEKTISKGEIVYEK